MIRRLAEPGPRRRGRIEERGAEHDAPDLGTADLYLHTGVKHVEVAEQLERPHPDQNRPGAGQADADMAEWERCRVPPAGGEMIFRRIR